MQPKALIFDVFGTCVDWRTGVASAVMQACAARGIPIDALAVADHWRSLYQPSMAPVRDGRRAYLALDHLHRETLDQVLAKFGIAEAFDADARASLARAWEHLPPWDDTVPALLRLKQRTIIAPCSNGSIALMTRLARFAALPWDCILGADLARSYKPDPSVYRAACSALQLPPEDVMMVAAHNDDLHAASREGLQTAFIPRRTEHGETQKTDLEPEGKWSVIANDLGDLASRLGA